RFILMICAALMLNSLQVSAQVLKIPQPGAPGNSTSTPRNDFTESQPFVDVDAACGNSNAVFGDGDASLCLSADLLSRLVDRRTVESGPVSTFVMEADVRGSQTTTTSVRLRCVPDAQIAHLEILASGIVSSSTVGYTPQAQVMSSGSHTFQIVKPVYFDGTRLLTKQGFGTIQARQCPQSVRTGVSGLPLIGPLGDRYAWSEMLRRMPTSDAIVVRQVADDVLPKVNSQVDGELADLNQNWQTFRTQVEQSLSDRVTWSARSRQDDILLTLNTTAGPVGAAVGVDADCWSTAPEAVVLMVHENLINRLLSRLPYGGMTITDTSLQQLVQAAGAPEADRSAALAKVFRELKYESGTAKMFSIRTADQMPLAVSFERDQVVLQLRFRILPKSGRPFQMMVLNIALQADGPAGEPHSLRVRQMTAEPFDRNEEPDKWTTLINQQASEIVNHLPPVALPQRFDLFPSPTTGTSPIAQEHSLSGVSSSGDTTTEGLPAFVIHRMQSRDGRLRVSLTPETSSQHPANNF
ncbi:MAG: hypothetical protein KDA89_08110, partial [Planctomycetaceae bacterium]|nr:hypothetical protein [Planctomycetaceae bacterium]